MLADEEMDPDYLHDLYLGIFQGACPVVSKRSKRNSFYTPAVLHPLVVDISWISDISQLIFMLDK